MAIKHWMTAGLCCICLTAVGCGGAKTGDLAGSVANTTPSEESAVAADESAAEESASAEEVPAGEVKLTEADWPEVQAKVTENQGKVVVLDVWSTSCGPCMKEFPNLVKLHNKHQGGDVVCLSMSIDYDGIPGKPPEYYREKVMKFLTKVHSTLDNYLLTQESTQWYEEVGLNALPAVFVYNRQGELVRRFDNDSSDEPFTYEEINKLVDKLLAE